MVVVQASCVFGRVRRVQVKDFTGLAKPQMGGRGKVFVPRNSFSRKTSYDRNEPRLLLRDPENFTFCWPSLLGVPGHEDFAPATRYSLGFLMA